jgi:catechol 2,3-dioxygenase-like lactoylglutathione lyase family enzyme
MGLANGVHHLAICTKDIKTQIEFFTQVVGAELVALYWMHGVDNTFHGFLRLSDSSSIAFVQHPDIAKIQPVKGVSHAGWTAGNVAPGVMQHLALNVDTEADLLAIRDRVRAHGNWIMGPLDHGFCKSIYLAAPEGIMLEFSTSEGNAIDAEAWIDPEVQALAGNQRRRSRALQAAAVVRIEGWEGCAAEAGPVEAADGLCARCRHLDDE